MKIWKTKPSDENFARQAAVELHLPPLLARVISGYGFTDLESASKFIHPKLSDISDPFLVPGMDKAVERVWRAIAAKEKILVFGDYDVDGVVSTVLLVKVLQRLGARGVLSCLPDRQGEGYGLSVEALRRIFGRGKPDLIITVDCGIKSLEAAGFVKSEGVDLVITDHHEIGDALPEAVAVVNPKMSGNDSLKMLAGVGVVFKLCHALLKHGRTQKHATAFLELKEYLDLVALGTVADIVPLLHENRVFVRHGLARLNSCDLPVWRALKETASLKNRIDVHDLAFCIAPRINAAGRLDSAEMALELFLTEDESRAKSLAEKLDAANRERQAIEVQILKEAAAEIDGYFKPDVHYGIVVGRRSWHIGVVGIVASRLAGRYGRPVIVIGFDERGAGRGSGRSINGYNILNGLNESRAVLKGFGGHEMAAGLEINDKKLEEFRCLFNSAVAKEMKGRDLTPVLHVNAWIKLEEVTEENFKVLEQLSPFGQGNTRPVFAARGVKITAPPRIMAGKHLRFSVSDGRKTMAAVAFNQAADATGRSVLEGEFDLAFQIRKNSFNGSENLELNVLDFRKANAADEPDQR